MDYKRTLELLRIEKKCIMRNENGECNRDCANCELVQTTGDLLKAYDEAIKCVEMIMEKKGERNESLCVDAA